MYYDNEYSIYKRDVQYLLLSSLLFLFVVCRGVKFVALPYMKRVKESMLCERRMRSAWEWQRRQIF